MKHVGKVIEFDDFEGEHHKGLLMTNMTQAGALARYMIREEEYNYIFRKSHVKGKVTVYTEVIS